ncbi:hypothetical protein [Saccharothrix sp. NRRL B-16348]|uniref:hypothetical protein n=1 Tax=Saccharothrix sp. NRRL B-16348 TaxID=1415542 RepID=UPI000B24B91A|nr:hypothetical protein [Saccharothrix sp. NRRL B-16348]
MPAEALDRLCAIAPRIFTTTNPLLDVAREDRPLCRARPEQDAAAQAAYERLYRGA